MTKRFIAIAIAIAIPAVALAAPNENKIKFDYKDAELSKVVGDFAKAKGVKVVVDPSTRAKITILNPGPISIDEAYEQLSGALALNGVGISDRDGTLYIMQARMLQRSFIPIVREAPPLKPERMLTMIYQVKHTSAEEINKQLRILSSKDGELVPFTPTNQILISDWSSNLVRISGILKEIDIPTKK